MTAKRRRRTGRSAKPRAGDAAIGSSVQDEIAAMLERARTGDAHANEDLFAALYDTLRRYAGAAMRRQSASHTLTPTALVNEAFLKLVAHGGGWEGRAHFLGVAGRAMRSILVDHARRHALKRRRTATARRVSEGVLVGDGARTADVIALDEALTRLGEMDERAARIVELRFFGGLTLPEIARLLRVPLRTVERDWQWAKMWLHAELS